MAKPVMLTVDDDPDVLRAVERDLRRQYGDRYRVISADSGDSALEAVKQLKLRNEAVALFLVDQRMPRMSGVEFLEKAIEFYPDAKRALLTAYADTDAAIRAINNVQITIVSVSTLNISHGSISHAGGGHSRRHREHPDHAGPQVEKRDAGARV